MTQPDLPKVPVIGKMERRVRSAFFGCPTTIGRVFAQGRFEEIASMCDIYPDIVSLETFDEHAEKLRDVEAIFSTWGMPVLEPSHLDRLPSLAAVFYAAGSVRAFAEPLLERGIVVVSAWQANAVPVAEFTQAQILLSTKGYFRNTQEFRSPQDREVAFQGNGNFGETVALLGAGAIGRRVIELLRPFNLKVIVYDPFLREEDAFSLGVSLVSLEDAFRQGYVVSNHLADVPETKGLLDGTLFKLLRQNATFINTGRGATVNEGEMIEFLRHREDVTALLDVTWPEPPVEGSPLYSLPNAYLSTHLAGSINDEFVRMADLCISEFRAWRAGESLAQDVSLKMLQMSA